MREGIGTLLVCLAIIAGLFWYINHVNEKCNAKGGAYVQGQCLKIEVIK